MFCVMLFKLKWIAVPKISWIMLIINYEQEDTILKETF